MSDRLTAKAAAAFLGVPVRSVYALPIPRYTLSARRIRFDRADLEDHMLTQLRAASTTYPNPAGMVSADVLG